VAAVPVGLVGGDVCGMADNLGHRVAPSRTCRKPPVLID